MSQLLLLSPKLPKSQITKFSGRGLCDDLILNFMVSTDRLANTIRFPLAEVSGTIIARIVIQWVASIECQCWQDTARIWQKITNHRKTQISYYVSVEIRAFGTSKYVTKFWNIFFSKWEKMGQKTSTIFHDWIGSSRGLSLLRLSPGHINFKSTSQPTFRGVSNKSICRSKPLMSIR